MAPVTRYARSGEASIAYQTIGDGKLDLLFTNGWISQVEQLWESPALRRMFERMSVFSRLILLDRRGTGLSDGAGEPYSLEQEARDVLAVLDAVGSQRTAVFTYGLGGPVGVLLAAEHRARIGALIMYASVTRTTWAPDYDWAMTVEERAAWTEQTVASWGEVTGPTMPVLAPSAGADPSLAAWFARLQRLAASPTQARVLLNAGTDVDVRELLPRVAVPTLVMHRTGDGAWDPRHSRYIAQRIAGAHYLELDGVDSLPFVGDSGAIVEEIEEFLTGARSAGEVSRALLTVVFTDIVDATARAAELGDARWRDLLARHDEELRKELRRFDGEEVKTIGDGFLATFAGPPSRALRAAIAIIDSARELGIDLRVGLHTGECELIGEDVGGMAVHIAARVGALAGPGEVLVSGTVFGTVVGGPFTFTDRGLHELKGVPGRWPLFALES
jgi:class 3 adenylate cyclase/pimeloyl-ACP methyl ester carboxylesterase